MDLDHFKAVNDTYGHDAGNVVLQAWSKYLQETLRPTDFLGRAGGEEVIAVLPNANEKQAFVAMDRIRKNMPLVIAQTTASLGMNRDITMSVGVAEYIIGESLSLEDPNGLIKRSDQRMLMAKEAGRNRVVGSLPPQIA